MGDYSILYIGSADNITLTNLMMTYNTVPVQHPRSYILYVMCG